MALETTVTAAVLAARLNKKADDPEVARCLATAVGLLEDATATAFRPIPVGVMDSLVIRVARSEWDGSRQQHGGAQAGQVQGETVVRQPRDPLAVAMPILSRYVIGFA